MSRDKVTEIASRLRDAARLQDPFALAAIELVKLSSDAAKESLVSAEGDDMLRLQGAARHLTKLHKELTTQPPGIQAPENKR
jgi:hypothetical protein